MYSALTNTFFESKEVYLGYGEAAAGLGLMVGPIIGGALNAIFNYFVCYIALCVFICMDIVFTIFVMPSDKDRNEEGKGELEALTSMNETEEEKQ